MNGINSIYLNWLPINFSNDYVSIFFLQGSEEREGHKLYNNIKLSEKGERITGLFLFDEAKKTQEHELKKVDIFEKDNVHLIKEYIRSGIEHGLKNDNYKILRKRHYLCIIPRLSKKEIIPEFNVYDQFIIFPYYIFDRRDKSIVFGIVIDKKNEYEFNILSSELNIFINYRVEALIGKDRYTGILDAIEKNSATIQYLSRIEKFNYEEKTLNTSLDNVKPLASLQNFHIYSSKRYAQNKDDLMKQLKIMSGSLTSAGHINQNILKDKYQKTGFFIKDIIDRKNNFSIYDERSTSFKIEYSYIPVSPFENVENLSIFGKRLEKRKFFFGETKAPSIHGQYQGIKMHGPLKSIENSNNVKYLFIYADGKKHLAESLYFGLKNGFGYFSGIESFFKMPIHNDNIYAIKVPYSSDMVQLSENYRKEIEFYLSKNYGHIDAEKTLAYVISPQMQHGQHPNPYHASKAILFKYGIASQGVDFETIENKVSFRWALSNIALASFAKLGGIPWRVANPLNTQQLIFGVGQKYLYHKESNRLKRVIGFTVCVTPDGLFHSITTFKPFNTKNEFLANLKEQIIKAITKTISSYDEKVEELVVHFPKKISKEEVEKIEEALEELATHSDKVLPYAAVRVTDSEPFTMWDLSHETCLPSEGNIAKLNKVEALMCIPGRQEKRSISTVPKNPLRISLEKSTLAITKYDQLLYQIYSLAGANWRGFNARELPISIFYSELIADLISDLEYYDIDFYEGLRKLEKIPWFL